MSGGPGLAEQRGRAATGLATAPAGPPTPAALAYGAGGALGGAQSSYGVSYARPVVVPAGGAGASAGAPTGTPAASFASAAEPTAAPAAAYYTYRGAVMAPAAPCALPHGAVALPVHPPPSSELPAPEVIEKQKKVYERNLDAELENSKKLASQQVSQQKEALKMAAEQQLATYKAQLDQAVKQQELGLEQSLQHRTMELHQTLLQQKTVLEQQASHLSMEYQQRKLHEDVSRRQLEMHQEMAAMQLEMHQEMASHHQQSQEMQAQHAAQAQEMQDQQRRLQEQMQREAQQHQGYAQQGYAQCYAPASGALAPAPVPSGYVAVMPQPHVGCVTQPHVPAYSPSVAATGPHVLGGSAPPPPGCMVEPIAGPALSHVGSALRHAPPSAACATVVPGSEVLGQTQAESFGLVPTMVGGPPTYAPHSDSVVMQPQPPGVLLVVPGPPARTVQPTANSTNAHLRDHRLSSGPPVCTPPQTDSWAGGGAAGMHAPGTVVQQASYLAGPAVYPTPAAVGVGVDAALEPTSRFFEISDRNHHGVISRPEWRAAGGQ